MAVDTNPIGTSEDLPIDTAETIALYKLPAAPTIERSYHTSLNISPAESFDYRVDVGVLPEGVDEPDGEGDIDWFQGVISTTKDNADDEHETVRLSATYVRVVVTTAAATGGSTATTAFCIGR